MFQRERTINSLYTLSNRLYVIIYYYTTQNTPLFYIKYGYFRAPISNLSWQHQVQSDGSEEKLRAKSLHNFSAAAFMKNKRCSFSEELRPCRGRLLILLSHDTRPYTGRFTLRSILCSQHTTHGFCVIKCVTLDTQRTFLF